MNWISVKERLPEEGVLVLTINTVFAEYPEYKADYLVDFGEEKVWAHRLWDDHHKVSHWMPLPEPPKDCC